MLPVGLDFSIAKGRTLVATQIFNISRKITSIKNYEIRFLLKIIFFYKIK